MSDVHAVARDQLRSFIERIENLESEKQAIADDIKDVKGEAKGMGYCVKTINTIIKMRKQDADERAEQEAILDTYLISLGMLPQPDLFDDEDHDAVTGELSPKLAHTIVTGLQTQAGRSALVAAVDIMIDREEKNTRSDAPPASAAAVISSSSDTAKGEAGSPVGLPEILPETADDAVVRIELSQGQFATIDAADAPLVSQYKWFAAKSNKTFYAARMDHENGDAFVYMHRELMGAEAGQIIDHENRDGLDNRRSNLRFANNSLNAANAEMQSNNTSGLRGVWKAGNRWKARVFVDGEDQRLGSFLCKYDAADAYDRASKEAFGEFAYQNSQHNLRPETCGCGCRLENADGVEPPSSVTFEAVPPAPMKRPAFASCFPEISGNAYNALAADINRDGVQEPIVRMGDVIVDGWARYNIARSLGIEYPVIAYRGNDVLLDVIRLQRSARDFTPAQERRIAEQLAKQVPHRTADIFAAFHIEEEFA